MIERFIFKSTRLLTALTMMTFMLLAVLCCPTVVEASSSSRQLQQTTDQTLMGVIYNIPELAFLSFLLEGADMKDDLDNGDISANNQLTIFAPIDKAFETIDEELLTYLLTDSQWKSHLLNLLGYHIVADQVILNLDDTATNIVGETLTLSSSDNDIFVNGYAKVVKSFGTLDGVVHTIDNVLDPGWLNKNLMGVMEEKSKILSTWTSLINRVDSISTSVASSEPFTIFAPPNSAIGRSKLDLENNLDPNFIEEVLGYHMVPGIYTVGELSRFESQPLVTYLGDTLTVSTDSVLRITKVNGHVVIESNILANNGIVHVVDGVLSDDPPSQIEVEDVEMCTFSKVMEEQLGVNTGVQCDCPVVGDTVQLVCADGGGQNQCIPKNGFCNDDVDNLRCCSPSNRRCMYGQCRDSKQVERTRVGSGHGGAVGRLRRDRSSMVDERTTFP